MCRSGDRYGLVLRGRRQVEAHQPGRRKSSRVRPPGRWLVSSKPGGSSSGALPRRFHLHRGTCLGFVASSPDLPAGPSPSTVLSGPATSSSDLDLSTYWRRLLDDFLGRDRADNVETQEGRVDRLRALIGRLPVPRWRELIERKWPSVGHVALWVREWRAALSLTGRPPAVRTHIYQCGAVPPLSEGAGKALHAEPMVNPAATRAQRARALVLACRELERIGPDADDLVRVLGLWLSSTRPLPPSEGRPRAESRLLLEGPPLDALRFPERARLRACGHDGARPPRRRPGGSLRSLAGG